MCKTFNRDAVLHELYISREMREALAKMQPSELREDLKQEIFIVLCKLPDAQLQGLHERGELRWYAVRVMVNMIKSDRSTFHNTYRRVLYSLSAYGKDKAGNKFEIGGELKDDDCCISGQVAVIDSLPQDDTWHDRVEEIVNSLDPYEAGLLKLYAEMGQSCKPIAEATKIPVRSVRLAVAQAKTNAKNLLRQC